MQQERSSRSNRSTRGGCAGGRSSSGLQTTAPTKTLRCVWHRPCTTTCGRRGGGAPHVGRLHRRRAVYSGLASRHHDLPSAREPGPERHQPLRIPDLPIGLGHGRRSRGTPGKRLPPAALGLCSSAAYGRGVLKSFAADFARLGGSVVETDPYVPTTRSLEPYLSRMRQVGIDVLLLAADRRGAELALQEERALGVRWPVIGGDALTGIETLGTLAEGMRISTAYLPDRAGEKNAALSPTLRAPIRACARITGRRAPTTSSTCSRGRSRPSVRAGVRCATIWRPSAAEPPHSTVSRDPSRSTRPEMPRPRAW